MPTRYSRAKIIINNSEYYAPLRKSRDLKAIRQYATIKLRNPTVLQRATTKSDTHIWSYGDRLYNLANQYYGDSRYWWVIAWWNGFGVEAQIPTGAVLSIPLNIETALKTLGVV